MAVDKPGLRMWAAIDETRPSLTTYQVKTPNGELSEKDYQEQVEGIKRLRRGVQIEIEKVGLKTDRIKLEQANIDHGIAKIGLETKKENFLAASYSLVSARAKTATEADKAAGSVAEWKLNQQSISAKVQSLYYSVTEATDKNESKRATVQAQGVKFLN